MNRTLLMNHDSSLAGLRGRLFSRTCGRLSDRLARLVGTVATVAVLGCTCLLGACTTFADPSTVMDLRLLSVRAEPSEIIVTDPDAPPAQIKLWPLLADSSGEVSDATFSIVGCPNLPFGPAPPADPMATGGFPAGGVRGTLSSSLCPSDPASPHVWPLGSSADRQADGSVSISLSAEQITDALKNDVFRDQFGNIHGGFDLGLPINLELDVTRGDTSFKAVKRVMFWFPAQVPAIAGETPNKTPLIDSVQRAADRNDQAVLQNLEPFDDPCEHAPDSTPPCNKMRNAPVVAPGGVLWVKPSLADQEPFVTTVLDSTTGEVTPYSVAHEALRYSYYATLGKFSPGSTSTDLSRGGRWKDGQPHIEGKYEAPGLAELPFDSTAQKRAADVTIWVVVRDERGGSSWVERHLRVSEP